MLKRMLILTILVFPLLVSADNKRTESPNDKLFSKCIKLLRFGDQVVFYKPSKREAVAALGLLGDERAIPVLVEHLQNEEDDNLRLVIVRALGWIKSAKAVPALEKALKEDTYELTRKAAAEALKDITGKDYQPDK